MHTIQTVQFNLHQKENRYKEHQWQKYSPSPSKVTLTYMPKARGLSSMKAPLAIEIENEQITRRRKEFRKLTREFQHEYSEITPTWEHIETCEIPA